MAQMVVFSSVLSECGTGILPGWRRALSAMWRFVVSVSQMGVSSSSSSSRRFRLADSLEVSLAAFLMCARRALEAFRVCVEALVCRVEGLGGLRCGRGTHLVRVN